MTFQFISISLWDFTAVRCHKGIYQYPFKFFTSNISNSTVILKPPFFSVTHGKRSMHNIANIPLGQLKVKQPVNKSIPITSLPQQKNPSMHYEKQKHYKDFQAFNNPKHPIELNDWTHQLDSHFLPTLHINTWNKQKHQRIKRGAKTKC